MYETETKAVLKNVGADDELISNENLNHKLDLLTLVKVSEGRFWPVQKFRPMEYSLTELTDAMEEEDLDYKEELLVKDFKTTIKTSGKGEIGGGHAIVSEAKAEANVDTVDGLEQPVNMMSRKANVKKLRMKFSGRKINKDNMEMLGMKDRDKLTFVYQTVYNTGPVKLIRKSSKGGTISASCKKMLSLFMKGSRNEETSFTVPEKSTFAYGLMEIKLDEEKLKIPIEPWTHRGIFDRLVNDASNSNVSLKQVKEGLEMKEGVLQRVADLPVSTCCDLLKSLSELLVDRDALSLLEQTLDQCSKGEYERPQSQAVSSFMDLLDVSNVSTAVKDAVHMLISALDTLPDEAAPLLTSCSPDTLTVLNQLVDRLKEDGQAKLPESLPVPLQVGGELRWAAELICSTNQTLAELSEDWDRPELPPEVLLEVLCLAVQGLSLMQPRTNS